MSISYEDAEIFSEWLADQLIVDATGSQTAALEEPPSGKFWMSTLAPEEKTEQSVARAAMGTEGLIERLDPCATGVIVKPTNAGPWQLRVNVQFKVWSKIEDIWKKSELISVTENIDVNDIAQPQDFLTSELSTEINTITGRSELTALVQVEIEQIENSPAIAIQLINCSPDSGQSINEDNYLYEVKLSVAKISIRPFTLEALPDSFRYDRSIPAFGINSGVTLTDNSVSTNEAKQVDKYRPNYNNKYTESFTLSFDDLSSQPVPECRSLLKSYKEWGGKYWSESHLNSLAKDLLWSPQMTAQAFDEASKFENEYLRIEAGVNLIESNELIGRSFMLMNKAMAGLNHKSWRPFQLSFILANLISISQSNNDSDFVDIVWFATGGGKTETYLGLILTAMFYDRLTGKHSGVTAWSRFPLRMLSLQQTQRFANAIAAADIVREEEAIEGSPFSLGFFVGQGGTPNSFKEDGDSQNNEPDPDDTEQHKKYRVLSDCPYCFDSGLEIKFNKMTWILEHICTNSQCQKYSKPLPFYIVDHEIYRFLPSVVVGTLDKAAGISMQAAMKGLVTHPNGKCTEEKHGYTYATRGVFPNGCLVPGCKREIEPLDMPSNLFPPRFRLQDELHLLKDSLGAVDSHYESLYDYLQERTSGYKPKIVASSATLSGFEKQSHVLYNRSARVFPLQGPTISDSFWSTQSDRKMRRYISLAPRGVTLEFALDQALNSLQNCIRSFMQNPAPICNELSIDPTSAEDLVSLYGTNVIYGNTIRDLDAVTRSLDSQLHVEGTVNSESLTGSTDFERVRQTLKRLEYPEDNFQERVHIVTASSMMSHGVDIDRLNVMLMLGIPLTTSEFIQATARVGRTWPGIVFVLHKMARERDAGVYKSFDKFVEQGDRFVEPIAITRRSRRVLEKTLPGIELARILALMESDSGGRLTTVKKLREYFKKENITEASELRELTDALCLDTKADQKLHNDILLWLNQVFANLNDPGGTFIFPSDLTGPPMMSLRDVEEQVDIIGKEPI